MTTASFAQKKWIQVLHVAMRELGLDDEVYRSVLSGAAGVSSAREIKEWKQYHAALAAFKKLGFQVKGKTKTETKRNPEWISAEQEYYIRGLWNLASRKKDEASLRKMIKRISGVEDIRFLKKTDAQKVILALRDIAKKAGFDPDSENNMELEKKGDGRKK